MLGRLQHRLSLLGSGSRDLPARQQTLRGAIGWSYDLLDAGDRDLFACFSVFAGATDLGVGRGGLRVGPAWTSSRASRRWWTRASSGVATPAGGETRYRMLETIREYAAERLEEAGRTAELRATTCRPLSSPGSRRRRPARQAASASTLDRLEADHDDLRAAITWSVESGRRPDRAGADRRPVALLADARLHRGGHGAARCRPGAAGLRRRAAAAAGARGGGRPRLLEQRPDTCPTAVRGGARHPASARRPGRHRGGAVQPVVHVHLPRGQRDRRGDWSGRRSSCTRRRATRSAWPAPGGASPTSSTPRAAGVRREAYELASLALATFRGGRRQVHDRLGDLHRGTGGVPHGPDWTTRGSASWSALRMFQETIDVSGYTLVLDSLAGADAARRGTPSRRRPSRARSIRSSGPPGRGSIGPIGPSSITTPRRSWPSRRPRRRSRPGRPWIPRLPSTSR